jgi:hypothetical protein
MVLVHNSAAGAGAGLPEHYKGRPKEALVNTNSKKIGEDFEVKDTR